MARCAHATSPAERDQPRSRRNPGLQLHDPHTGEKAEASCPRTTWIHYRHGSVHEFEQRTVRVAVHDDLPPGEGLVQLGGRGTPELIPVSHHEVEPVEP